MMGTCLAETFWATIRREIKNTKSDIYCQPDFTTFPQPRHIPTRGYNIKQSLAPDDGHTVARNILSNYCKRNKEYKKWHPVGFSYPRWITMHGQPHIRFSYTVPLLVGELSYIQSVAGSSPRWGHWNLSLTYPSGCPLALGLTKRLTELLEASWGKGGHYLGLTALPPSYTDCLQICELQTISTLRCCAVLYSDCTNFVIKVIPRLTSDPANEFFG